ncbi:MAG: DoxX family protein [Patescibacteria group bacterium]
MTKNQHLIIFALRIALGILFLYSGISKIINPDFTAAGFIGAAQSLKPLYAWFATPVALPSINILNSWGQAAIGLSLVSGLFVRYSSIAGILMMVMYYFPGLHFPYVGKSGLLIDDHIIYILVFLIFISCNSGRFWGLDHFITKKSTQE